MIDNVFYLQPPSYLKPFNQTDSAKFFNRFVESTPSGIWPDDTKTFQGLYILKPDGDFLSGGFSYQSKHNARRIIDQGWSQWSKLNEDLSDPVPSELIPVVGGLSVSDRYAKCQVTYRDLPRGWNKRPGDSQFDNPHNLGWYDLTHRNLKQLVLNNNYYALKKLALATMKDAVRGEMIDWQYSD